MITDTITTPGAGTWTCPDNVHRVRVSATGIGGAGGAFAEVGGGGAAYARIDDYLVIPGVDYDVYVAIDTSEASWFDADTILKAVSGQDGTDGGAGGLAADCIGDYKYGGGNGGAPGAGGGGGGGGAGSDAGDGTNGEDGGATDGGAGGDVGGGTGGFDSLTDATAGADPGAGGGQAGSGTNAAAGGAAQITISYTPVGVFPVDGMKSKDPCEYHIPPSNMEVVTPDDVVNLAYISRYLYVGHGGDVTVVTVDGQTILFKDVPTGTILPVRIIRVNDTDTTATDMVSLW